MKEYRVLAMNFGSTSTKVAVYDGDKEIFQKVFRHGPEEMKGVKTMEDNARFRKPLILASLKEEGIELDSLDAIVGRGGLVRPIEGGTYAVNETMLEDLHSCKYGFHVCNLGGILASEIAGELGKPAYVVDPPVIYEKDEVASLSGHPDFPRRPLFHALNQKAIAKRFAQETGKPYESLNLIVAHMGGGTSVGCHRQGRVVDVNNGLEGEGAFTGERCGGLTALDVVRATLSGQWGTTYEQIRHELCMKSGLVGHTGTNDGREINRRIAAGDKKAELAYRAMAYQVSKEICAQAAPLKGKVDAILLTGGFAYDKLLMGWIEENVSFLAPVHVYPGEDEMMALAQGALRVLRGQEPVREY
ncbi:MAG: butyrate kinase [Oscillospiraceae bacterium]|nr:butyrate kinase [Oscillospiraceae bacterium]